jgi:hypothetical protein
MMVPTFGAPGLGGATTPNGKPRRLAALAQEPFCFGLRLAMQQVGDQHSSK